LEKEEKEMFEMVPWRRYRTPLAQPRKDLFNWFLEDCDLPGCGTGEREWMPAFDVSETEGELIVKAELSGMKVEDIDITLTDGLLTIKGERKMENEEVNVKADSIDAGYKDGILTVTLPKAEENKPKKIEVKN
jgi:HSP20 family protein